MGVSQRNATLEVLNKEQDSRFSQVSLAHHGFVIIV
jgi:hypothetical protein